MSSIFGVVEPLFSTFASIGFAMDVLDAKCVSRVDVNDRGTVFIGAELEFAKLLCTILVGCCVEACAVVSKSIAVFEGESIAFAYMRISLNLLN